MFNLIKTTAAATIIAVAPLAAMAESTFALQENVADSSSVTIDLLTAEEAGTLVIYDYTGGEFGEVLGTSDVTAGANDDVIINLDNNVAQSVAAVLFLGEDIDMAAVDPSTAAAWIELDVEDDS